MIANIRFKIVTVILAYIYDITFIFDLDTETYSN